MNPPALYRIVFITEDGEQLFLKLLPMPQSSYKVTLHRSSATEFLSLHVADFVSDGFHQMYWSEYKIKYNLSYRQVQYKSGPGKRWVRA